MPSPPDREPSSIPPSWLDDPRWRQVQAQRADGALPRPEEETPGAAGRPPGRRRWRLPLLLFWLTCLSTLLVGGPVYAAALMTILFCHEMGHFLQARRYGVPASLPIFIPMPISPIGTMGVVIGMRPNSTHAKGLYDIAISGPLAGLVPTLIFAVVGIRMSELVPSGQPSEGQMQLGEPLVFQWLVQLLLDVPEGMTLLLHPLAYAAWVGIFVTALNLLPVGQLDGGHILFVLAPRWSYRVSLLLVVSAAALVVSMGYWQWSLMVLLLILIGLRHPPVSQGGAEIGPGRRLLGWLTLAFLVLGLTPEPFILE